LMHKEEKQYSKEEERRIKNRIKSKRYWMKKQGDKYKNVIDEINKTKSIEEETQIIEKSKVRKRVTPENIVDVVNNEKKRNVVENSLRKHRKLVAEGGEKAKKS